MKKKSFTTMPTFVIFSVAMLAMSFASYSYDPMLCYIEIAMSVVTAGIVVVSTLRFRNYIAATVRSTAEKINGFNPEFLDKYKIPVTVLGAEGEIIWSNTRFRKQFCNGKNPEGDMISPYIGGKKITDVADHETFETACNGNEFVGFVISTNEGYVCYFVENTYYRQIMREYNATRPCVAIITFDNSDDFSNESDEIYSEVSLNVQSFLQRWANEYNALFKIIGNNRYMIIFKETDVDKLVEQKFPILQEIHGIKAGQHTATVSIGLCRGINSLKDSETNARKALDMALGRGGDQVAIISNNIYEFFGGTSATSEKVSKVRMRVIANAIKRTINDCDKVFVMGHRFSDLDCIGAAIGMQSVMEKSFNLYSKIVVDKTKTMAEKLIDYAEKNIGKDIFIIPDEAMKQVTPKTLLIIVDSHLRNSLESPQLYDECKKVIVIDHHRRAVNYIDNALVFCHEPFASSACEMCSEIISCIDDKAIGYAQADALLAGIMLDTKNFVLKTGVRTFEAAAYLRRRGATTINVKQMFSDSIETYREKVSIVCDAKIYRNCAISIAKGADGDVRLASAQAADELLTLENVKASFVIYESGGKICISARSFGAVNVQIIMEKLGGGGHQTMSATQLSDINKEQALKMLIEVIDTNLEDASCK